MMKGPGMKWQAFLIPMIVIIQVILSRRFRLNTPNNHNMFKET